MTEGNLVRKRLFQLIAHTPSLREVRAGTEAAAMEEYYLLACSTYLLKQLRVVCPKVHHPQWSGPSHINY